MVGTHDSTTDLGVQGRQFEEVGRRGGPDDQVGGWVPQGLLTPRVADLRDRRVVRQDAVFRRGGGQISPPTEERRRAFTKTQTEREGDSPFRLARLLPSAVMTAIVSSHTLNKSNLVNLTPLKLRTADRSNPPCVARRNCRSASQCECNARSIRSVSSAVGWTGGGRSGRMVMVASCAVAFARKSQLGPFIHSPPTRA